MAEDIDVISFAHDQPLSLPLLELKFGLHQSTSSFPNLASKSDPSPVAPLASEIFDGKLRPNGYRSGYNGEPIGYYTIALSNDTIADSISSPQMGVANAPARTNFAMHAAT